MDLYMLLWYYQINALVKRSLLYPFDLMIDSELLYRTSHMKKESTACFYSFIKPCASREEAEGSTCIECLTHGQLAGRYQG